MLVKILAQKWNSTKFSNPIMLFSYKGIFFDPNQKWFFFSKLIHFFPISTLIGSTSVWSSLAAQKKYRKQNEINSNETEKVYVFNGQSMNWLLTGDKQYLCAAFCQATTSLYLCGPVYFFECLWKFCEIRSIEEHRYLPIFLPVPCKCAFTGMDWTMDIGFAANNV